MTDDPILRELGRTIREDESRARALEEPLSSSDPEGDDEEASFLRRVMERADDQAAIAAAEAAFSRDATAVRAVPVTEVSASRDARGARATEGTPAVPSTLERSSAPTKRSLLPAFGGAFALAAALLLYVGFGRTSARLPDYEAEVTGTDAPDRSAPSHGVEVSPGARIVLVARPKTAVEDAVEGRAYAACGGPLRRLETKVDVAASGAARLEGRPEAFFGDARVPCTLVLAVAPKGEAWPESTPPSSARTVRVELTVRR
jgi:hypothetical protein